MTATHPGSRPWPSWLIGLALLSIAPVHGASRGSSPEYAYDDTLGFVQKSWDVLTVDVVDAASIQRIDKLRITAAPLMPDRKRVFARRASSTCPSSFSECASSLSGGCCPTGFACDVSDCVQTSTASATTTAFACGRAGYTGCGVADGGGCCPAGYTCGRQVCTPPAGATQSQQCPSRYYLCPSSLNFGCCATTMGCALNACYATTPSTVVFTATYTTTTDAAGAARVTTVTSTTVATPSPPTDTANAPQSGSTDAYVAKFVPTTTAKASLVAASGSSVIDNNSSGSVLSPGAIGGLIGGLVVLLVAVAVAAFFIIRNVRRTGREVEEAKRLSGSDRAKPVTKTPNTGSGSASRPRASMHLPTPSVINHMEVDDLLQDGPAGAGGTLSSSRMGTGHSHHRRQRASTATATSAPNTPDPALPPASAYSSPAVGAPAAGDGASSSGHFDLPQRTHNRPGHYAHDAGPRVSIDSAPTVPGRPRIVSNASYASNASEQPTISRAHSGTHTPAVGSPLQPAELGVDGGFIPELPVIQPAARPRPFSNISAVSGLSFAGFSPPLPAQQPLMSTDHISHGYHQRSWSGSSTSTTGHNTPQQAPQPPLDAVVEEHLHGHYGPAHAVAGQTRAGDVADQG